MRVLEGIDNMTYTPEELARSIEREFQNKRNDFIQPPIRYCGSKASQLPQLLPYLPNRAGWVDVFGGSGAVTLGRKPCRLEVFNDRARGLICFYRTLQQNPKALMERLELTLYSREEWQFCKDTLDDPDLSDLERGARWYTMLAESFSGIGRNFGRVRNAKCGNIAGVIQRKLPSFMPIHYRFKNVTIENLDFRDVIKDYDDPHTVIYCDPDYTGKNTGRYETGKMDNQDHVELIELIANCQGFVALSGYANPLYDAQTFWTDRIAWDRKTLMKNTEHTGADNPQAEEVLWIKEGKYYPCSKK